MTDLGEITGLVTEALPGAARGEKGGSWREKTGRQVTWIVEEYRFDPMKSILTFIKGSQGVCSDSKVGQLSYKGGVW